MSTYDRHNNSSIRRHSPVHWYLVSSHHFISLIRCPAEYCCQLICICCTCKWHVKQARVQVMVIFKLSRFEELSTGCSNSMITTITKILLHAAFLGWNCASWLSLHLHTCSINVDLLMRRIIILPYNIKMWARYAVII